MQSLKAKIFYLKKITIKPAELGKLYSFKAEHEKALQKTA